MFLPSTVSAQTCTSRISNTGGGNAVIDETNREICTTGEEHDGIKVQRLGGTTADIALTMTGGSITTSGDYAYGINVRQLGTGKVDVKLSGVRIQNESRDGYGIRIYYGNSSVKDVNLEVTNVDITTTLLILEGFMYAITLVVISEFQ